MDHETLVILLALPYYLHTSVLGECSAGVLGSVYYMMLMGGGQVNEIIEMIRE